MSNLPNPFSQSGALDLPPEKAASSIPEAVRHPDEAADLSCIGEIFRGAAKLEPPEIWFENSAYPPQDELLFDVLSAMVDPNAPCLREIPDEASFMIELGPPPLFLRNASEAA